MSFLDKKHTVAPPDFNRWLVPPAALAIHLSIGMAYGFSVFWLPLSRAIGITAPVAGDWEISKLGWIFTLFFVLLGSSAAVFGQWLEHNGPRKAGVAAAFCWGGGLIIAAFGVYMHWIWLMWLGAGVIGGCGLGLGYISPVSTLIKWFPDKRGMATGMAIMGFGGGAMVGMPLADKLMKFYETETSVGVWETFATLGVIYLIAMLAGAFTYRIPVPGWTPPGWTPPEQKKKAMKTIHHVHVKNAHRTPQFWLLWGVLTLNVSAGIGIIGMASPMLQEVFGGALIKVQATLSELATDQKAQVATIAAAFGGLLSLFNIGGRIFWASLSDKIGRKNTYHVFFVLGMILYIAASLAGRSQNIVMFVTVFCVILSMYGGGFSTIPAYLADLFGTRYVGAIHGRLLTAWSTAGILGPVLVNYIREFQIKQGIPEHSVYNFTLYILAGLLLVGFVCNLLVRPVSEKYYMTPEELKEDNKNNGIKETAPGEGPVSVRASATSWIAVAVAWTMVGIPLAWGVWKTIEKTAGLFRL